MKRCPPGVITHVQGEGEGPSAALYVSQPGDDPGGWTLELSAQTDYGWHVVGRHVLVRRGRAAAPGAVVLAVATVPGAASWGARVLPPDALALGEVIVTTPPTRGIDVAVLATNVGLAGTPHRPHLAGRGFQQATGAGPGAALVPPGARVNAYSVVATAAGPATVLITGPDDALPLITVPAGRPWSEAFFDPGKQWVGPAVVEFGGNVDAFSLSWFE